jgi:UDP-N-acetylmuramoyl-L-alanyl-D-glutamate--2,6-diaminopimelate ligase
MQRSFSDFFTPALAARCGAEFPRFDFSRGNPAVTSLTYDSRAVRPGSLYFALKGLHVDGHSFVRDAVARGASVVVHQDPLDRTYPDIVSIKVSDSRFAMSPIADAFWDSPSRSLAVIGVTGTEGKSTTVFLIYQLLELSGARAGFVSTVQHRTGDREEWNPEHQTTPEAPTIHAALAAMRDHGMEYAVIESSSHGLSPRTNRLGDVAFDVGVMTNVTHEHLEFHGTWERYRDDKANLFRALDRSDHAKTIVGAQRTVPAFAVANADDPSAAYFAAATARRTLTFSAAGAARADLSILSLESDAAGNSYRVAVCETGDVLDLRDNLPGAFNPKNVMAALLTVSGLRSIPVAELAPLAGKLRPVRGRMSPIDRGQPFEVIVDYAHTPSSFETVLPPVKRRIAAGGGRVISLFGSGGERDREKRPRQGRIAADWSDIVILADEDPRGEDPMALLEEIAAGCPEKVRGSELYLIPDRPTAIRQAFALARPGDAVLLLGKGHENSIIYRDRTIAFDEIREAEQALAELGYGAQP